MNLQKMVVKDSNFNIYEEYAQKWSPYKTIACLHLWKLVD